MDPWRTDWMETKRAVALRLASGECGGSCVEGSIILCAAISALAAEVWPGKHKDKVRFVEVLTQDFAPNDLNTTRISVPLFVWYLERESRKSEAVILRKSFLGSLGPGRQNVSGDDVDKSEGEIFGLFR
jgi:hypothetical protein